MPITYPIDFPTSFGVSDFNIGLDHAVSVSESEFTFEEQVQEHQGVAWDISFTIELLDRAQAEEYNAFILKLAGRKGTFTMAIPGSEAIRGVGGGTPLVNGAGQTGHDLAIDGLPVSTTGIYLPGDFIGLGTGTSSKLHKVLDQVDSNGSGEATLVVAPKIVTAPADNATITVASPKVLLRAKQNMNPVNIKPPNQHTINFAAREAIGAT